MKDVVGDTADSGTDAPPSAGLDGPAPEAAANAADEATPTVPSAAAPFRKAQAAAPAPFPPVSGGIADSSDESSDAVAAPVSGIAETGPGWSPGRGPSSGNRVGAIPPSTRAVKDGSRALEQLIGGRIMAVVGGVIVILAGLFFAKLAYDSGWIGGIPPIVRALTLAGFGVVLLVAGEVVHRRFGKAAAIGPFLAGLGILYVDAWVSGTVLGLLDPLGSLVAMGLVTIVGIVVTARSGSVAIGITSIAAGAFAPYLAGGDGEPAGLGIYLTALLVVAFVAASIRPRPFLRIRVPAFSILLVAATPWMFLSIDKGEVTVLLIIGSGWWLLVHAQALHTATRGLASKWNAGLGSASTAVFAIAMPLAVRAAGGGVVAWNTLEGWIPLGLAALAMVTIFQAGTGLDAIRRSEDRSPLRRRERAVDLLSLVLWVETAVLLFVAAGLLLEGPAIPVAWCGLGLAAAYLAHRIRSRGVAVCSLLIALLGQFAATVVVLMNAGNRNVDPWFKETGWQWQPEPNQWLPLLAPAVIALVARLWPVRSTSSEDRVPAGPSVALWMGGLLFVPSMIIFAYDWSLMSMVVAGIPVLAALIVQRGRRDRAGWSAAYGLNLLATVIAVFLLLSLVSERQGWGPRVGFPPSVSELGLFAWAMIPFAVLMAMMIDLARKTESGPSRGRLRIVGWASSVQFLLAGAFAAMLLFVPATTSWSLAVGNLLAATVGVSVVGTALVLASGRTPLRVGRSLAAKAVLMAALAWGLVSLIDAFEGTSSCSTSAPLAANLRFWSGVIALLTVGAIVREWPRAAAHDVDGPRYRDPFVQIAGLEAIVLGLLLGSLALLDFFGPDEVTLNAALSVFWGLYAIGLVIAGFVRDVPVIRHIGLGLLGVTLLKFLVIDLSRAATIWRVLSALGVGLLMVATSMLYVRFGSKLQGQTDEPSD
ncbi:MAG: DUF2339 domain-containing protein [Phycisphaerales bacterium]|nr:DUF2339 domain-containing protein [Phycisphaerales bacterium]